MLKNIYSWPGKKKALGRKKALLSVASSTLRRWQVRFAKQLLSFRFFWFWNFGLMLFQDKFKLCLANLKGKGFYDTKGAFWNSLGGEKLLYDGVTWKKKKWAEMHFKSRGTTIITDKSGTFIGGYGFSHRKICPLVTLYWEILCEEQVLINFSQDLDLGSSSEIPQARKILSCLLGCELPLSLKALQNSFLRGLPYERAASALSGIKFPLCYQGVLRDSQDSRKPGSRGR